jgi:hypothetical protein
VSNKRGDTSTSIEIYSKVSEYLARHIALRDLESWLAPRLPIYLEHPDSAVGQFAGVVELCLAEHHAGIIAERTVRKRLSGHAAEPAAAHESAQRRGS